MRADFHLHSCFSGDCDTPIETLIQKAQEQRLDAICFTDHIDADYPYDDVDFSLDLPRYFREIQKLREACSGRLCIYTGVELGLQPHLCSYYMECCQKYPFDFVIGSTHLTDRQDPYYSTFWEGRSVRSCVERFFLDTLQNIQSCGACFDVYGHLDYVNRYIPSGNPPFSYFDYADHIDACLCLLIQGGKGLEVNTGGYKAGLPVPNPSPDILRRYRELGGEILTTGSDAHFPEYVGYRFQQAYALMRECGFRYVTIFKERKAEFVPL